MIIEFKEKIIEIQAEEGFYLKDLENNTFEGICFLNKGQTEEELRMLYTEIEAEEIEETELEDEQEMIDEENLLKL
jgi:hypothetical protein